MNFARQKCDEIVWFLPCATILILSASKIKGGSGESTFCQICEQQAQVDDLGSKMSLGYQLHSTITKSGFSFCLPFLLCWLHWTGWTWFFSVSIHLLLFDFPAMAIHWTKHALPHRNSSLPCVCSFTTKNLKMVTCGHVEEYLFQDSSCCGMHLGAIWTEGGDFIQPPGTHWLAAMLLFCLQENGFSYGHNRQRKLSPFCSFVWGLLLHEQSNNISFSLKTKIKTTWRLAGQSRNKTPFLVLLLLVGNLTFLPCCLFMLPWIWHHWAIKKWGQWNGSRLGCPIFHAAAKLTSMNHTSIFNVILQNSSAAHKWNQPSWFSGILWSKFRRTKKPKHFRICFVTSLLHLLLRGQL